MSRYVRNMRSVCVFDAVCVCKCAGQSKTGSIVEAFQTLLSHIPKFPSDTAWLQGVAMRSRRLFGSPKLELRAWKGIVQIRLLVWHTSHFMSGLSLATTIYHHPLRVTSTDPAAPVGSGMLKQTAVGIPTCAKNKDSSPSRMQGQTL